MDSYLSSIDAYMQQQEQNEKQQQHFQQQQQQPAHSEAQFPSDASQTFDFSEQSLTDIWLNNLPTSSNMPLYYNDENSSNATGLLPDIPALSGIPSDSMNNGNVNNFNVQPVEPVYLTNFTAQQPVPAPTFDMHGRPIRIRKKPGRKPNPASPALRKAQNRAAQRAFRERKERHLKDLESTIRSLRDQRNSATKEANALKKKLEAYKVENWYLKGVVLTLQLICYHRNVSIATHSPYLSDTILTEIAKTSAHSVDAYSKACKNNNLNLKTSLSNETKSKLNSENDKEETQSHKAEDDQMDCTMNDEDSIKETTQSITTDPSHTHSGNEEDSEQPGWTSKIDESDTDKINAVSPIPNLFSRENPLESSLDAIHYIRLKLGLKATLANNHSITDISAARLKPTILQLAIPHDPRIDLIPTPHMRDRMIIFREQMDYDRCFSLLLNEAVYHGGDPTLSESWELPVEFFNEFWYLCIHYDVRKTNKWRRIRGLADVFEGPQVPEEDQREYRGLKNSDVESIWNEEALDEIVKSMPVLKPIMEPDTPSSSTQFESNDKDKPEYYYERMMGIAVESRKLLKSPTYGKLYYCSHLNLR